MVRQKGDLWQQVKLSFFALVLAILLGIGIIIIIGKNPIEAASTMIMGAFGGRYAFSEVLVKTTPLLLAGLGTAFAFRCRIWNIGAEGQMLIGALIGTVVCLFLPTLSGSILIICAVFASFVAGGLWSSIAGFLKAKLGSSEIIVTIMLNYISVYLISYFLRGPLKAPGIGNPVSVYIPEQAWLLKLIPSTRLHIGFLFAIFATIAVYFILWHTSIGFKTIAVGSSYKAAQVGGISITSTAILAMFISGGLSGIAGAGEILGIHHRLLEGVSANYGFDAMFVAILGFLHPAGIAFFSFFLAVLRVGFENLQTQMGVPVAVLHLMEGIVIIFLQGRNIFRILSKQLSQLSLSLRTEKRNE